MSITHESSVDQLILRVRNLGVTYPPHTPALDNISFDVAPGELVAVVGPNGAGKSTLLKAITGLVVHRGEIELCGTHCHHQRDRLAAAYIPQRSDLDHDFPITVEQLVLAGRRRFLRLGQRPGPIHRQAAREALQRVGLANLRNRPLGTLSGGQAQRVFLARALAQEAHLILLDEALSGVDQPRTEAMLDLFEDLTSSGTALMVATHDLPLARRRFSRCLAVHRFLVADGPPETALNPAGVEATFAGGPNLDWGAA